MALNAGPATSAAALCATLPQGIHMAPDASSAGLAKERLDELVRISTLMGDT